MKMKLKEEPIRCANAASDAETTTTLLHLIEPALSPDKLTAADLQTSPALKTFLETHCHSSHYVFQIRKCLDPSCYYCQQHPIRVDPEKIMELSFLPLPLLDVTKEHYSSFTDLCGSQPSEKDRPSLQQSGDPDAIDADAKHKHLFYSSKVRGTLHCQECFKPRCVYSARKLGRDERVLIERVDEEKTYSCGSALFHSILVDTVVVRQNIGCTNPIETEYYSATFVSFPPVCYYCGAAEESLVEDDNTRQLKQEYAIVRPLCFLCKSEGKTPFVRMPSNVRKHPRLN